MKMISVTFKFKKDAKTIQAKQLIKKYNLSSNDGSNFSGIITRKFSENKLKITNEMPKHWGQECEYNSRVDYYFSHDCRMAKADSFSFKMD